MKTTIYNNAVILSIISLLNINVVWSQTKIEKNMLELNPNQVLVEELKVLTQEVSDCDYHTASLIWNIGISGAEQGCVLNISMQEDINVNYEYVGFFYLDDILFVVSGIFNNQLFTSSGNKKLKFNKKKKNSNQIVITPSGDYSNWIYLLKDNSLSLLKKYPIPCN